LAQTVTGRPMRSVYEEGNRQGDHICYISDLNKVKAHYPGWSITKDLKTTAVEICETWMARLATTTGRP